MTRRTLLLTLAALLGASAAHAETNEELALQARGVLKQHCYRCHHGEGSDGGEFDVLKDATLTAKPADGEKPYVLAGKPDQSYLLQRLEKNAMPPKAIRERPTDADKAIIRKWISAGAPAFPAAESRVAIPQKAALLAMRDHLRRIEPEDRPFARFFTLTHLHNNPLLPDADIRVQRAALSKAVNSLSWKPRLVLPKALDQAQTVFAVDLRDLDWDRDNLWTEVMKAYPYGLRFDNQPDTDLRDLDREVSEATRCEIPYVRGDWFVATATRPPLYHAMLQLPKTAGELEKLLRVDVTDNFRRDRLARAGFRASGVSAQNRLVERHEGLHGAYWKSYDFKPKRDRADLAQFPLGPNFRDNPFEELAFNHDGGEIIFHLPNGLQGYLLVDGKDNRIDQGPEEVVNDPLKTSGAPAIVNGQSCMACHSQGTRTFTDQIRDGSGVFGEALRKVKRLYPEQKAMEALVKEDQERFMKALEQATGPFLRTEADKNRDLREFQEPVGEVARLYRLGDLDLTTAGLELDMNPEELKVAIAGNRRLRELGIAPLLQDKGVVKRQEWESLGARSLFQRVALELGKGSPNRVLK
jgi:mono/diheme cytochrome c family protein